MSNNEFPIANIPAPSLGELIEFNSDPEPQPLDLVAIRAGTRGLVYIEDGSRASAKLGRVVEAHVPLLDEVERLRTQVENVNSQAYNFLREFDKLIRERDEARAVVAEVGKLLEEDPPLIPGLLNAVIAKHHRSES